MSLLEPISSSDDLGGDNQKFLSTPLFFGRQRIFPYTVLFVVANLSCPSPTLRFQR